MDHPFEKIAGAVEGIDAPQSWDTTDNDLNLLTENERGRLIKMSLIAMCVDGFMIGVLYLNRGVLPGIGASVITAFPSMFIAAISSGDIKRALGVLFVPLAFSFIALAVITTLLGAPVTIYQALLGQSTRLTQTVLRACEK